MHDLVGSSFQAHSNGSNGWHKTNGAARVITLDEPATVPVARPSAPSAAALTEDLDAILSSGVLTNGPYVRELERKAAEYLGVRHCVAVASCTAGLMLVLRGANLSGDVVVPSFTFAATAHAVSWNGLRPVWADVDADTLTLSPSSVARACGVRTSAIIATHIYGTPCDVEGLSALARRNGIRLFFDAAHAFGSIHQGRHVGGFGDAEVFSLSPTKVLTSGEGGIIATNDDDLAEQCRIGRDYGNPGDYDCTFVGLNARMSEFHALIALASLEDLEDRIHSRNRLAERYMRELSDVPGISFPVVRGGDRSTYKDFTILVDPDLTGIDAQGLGEGLAQAGIETRRYYSPAVHRMKAYRSLTEPNGHLPVTDRATQQVLSLPLWAELSEEQVARVCAAIRLICKPWGGMTTVLEDEDESDRDTVA